MKAEPNVVSDMLTFLTNPIWPTGVFWVLLIASCVIAVTGWRRQRSVHAACIWLVRLVVGGMWWSQSLWKIPPNYDGLLFFMHEIVDHSSVPLQATLVDRVMIQHIGVFGPLVYAAEALIGASFMLGVFTRWFALLGLAMALNLWVGLYSAPNEWPWTYGYLIVIQILFVIDPPGRCLGLEREFR